MPSDKPVYPVFPASCWWPLRNRFKQSLPAAVTVDYLISVLSIESKTARNLLPTLRAISLISPDGAPTRRANEWRVEEEYPSVCRQIREEIYPERLIHALPDPADRFGEAVQWFMKESGVGEPAAKRMARFYTLLTEADPSEGSAGAFSHREEREEGREGVPSRSGTRLPASSSRRGSSPRPSGSSERRRVADARRGEGEPPVFQRIIPADYPAHVSGNIPGSPVQLTINIHLSPEMSPEQIDELFASMARHLVPHRS